MLKAAELVGAGLYTITEASRLTRIPSRTIRRWAEGYHFRLSGRKRAMPPVWRREAAPERGAVFEFLDLLEVRAVHAFREAGVSWPTIRRVEELAQKRFNASHPLCRRRFRTDGRRVFVEAGADRDSSLVELLTSQRYFEQILAPCLHDLEFDEGLPLRWWPLGRSRSVVIDPRRAFGQPIVDRGGVATRVLAEALEANDSAKKVAWWYDVSEQAVRDAADFEGRLAA